MDISTYMIGLILAFARVSTFLFMIPYLRSGFIPVISKITIAVAISMSVASKMTEVQIHTLPDLVGMLLVQVLVGLTLGFVMEMIMSSASNAGGLLDLDMGFSAAQMMDPGTHQRVTIISNLFSIMFMLVFISIGGFNFLISSIIYSFKFTTSTFFIANPNFIETIVAIFTYMLVATIQIAIPYIATMFIINFTLLIIGKSAPQMNIFLNMYAVKVALGILFLFITLPFLGEVFVQLNDGLMERHMEVMELLFKK